MLTPSNQYLQAVEEINDYVNQAKCRASVSVNSEIMKTNIFIGNVIIRNSEWGNKFVENLNESVYFLNLVRLCAYTKKEIKKVILSTKSYTEKDLVDLPTIIDQWKNEYRSDRSLAWPTL